MLFVKTIDIVGSSIFIEGSASGFSKSAIVSPISKPSIPITAQISPDLTGTFTFSFPSPSKRYTSLTFDVRIVPSRFTKETFCPAIKLPLLIRPTAIRPTYEE